MPKTVSTVLTAVIGVVSAVVTLAALLGGGFAVTMARDFSVPAGAEAAAARLSHSAPAVAHDRIPVAVLLGANGSVATDVLGPYEVLARSPRFHVYTVSVRREPVALSGGLATLPDYSASDVLSGIAPEPAVVVVPAMADPEGLDEAPLRALVERTARRGNAVLGVCAGARVLAATDVLDGKRATSFWSDLPGLRSSNPRTTWEEGVRWVQDGMVLTTAGVSSGIAGALHLVERYTGAAEATRIAAEIGYPAWRPGPAETMPVNTITLADFPYPMAATLPWFQPTYGLMLSDGVDEIGVAATAELYGGAAFLAHVLPVADGDTVRTAHGLTLLTTPRDQAGTLDREIVPGAQKPGESAFEPVLRDISREAGEHVARTAAKYIEYPVGVLPSGGSFPARLVVLGCSVVLVAIGVGMIPWLLRRSRRRAVRGRRLSSV
ncbi:DJ-1/PfpI family protein [Leifsonia sp. ZF2019]|uniref:DJ-1/PfpI family protein n=1 Tax=Leifsonia sp. ZF2019 TaxID=2781978 RepID=UPI001CBAF853|nr:DJ-1/PfpI family protein [Leifsonia sp. ZF2019]UAJ79494.1 DJ-1/PfpI family protein [Leifsonia sp. ZF2019]